VVEEVARPTPAASSMMGIVLLLVVVAAAAVGMAFSYSTPFRVPTRTGLFPIAIEDAQRTTTLARMERVDSAIRTYFLSFGDYPNSLEDLLNANPALVSTSDLLDANDNPFLYDRTPDRVALAAIDEAGEPYLVFVHEVFPGTGSDFEGMAPEQP
jgi:hypothetical protein